MCMHNICISLSSGVIYSKIIFIFNEQLSGAFIHKNGRFRMVAIECSRLTCRLVPKFFADYCMGPQLYFEKRDYDGKRTTQ